MKSLIVYTSTYRYSGDDRLDITVKGNDNLGNFFSPTWGMVRDFKSKKLSELFYTKLYQDILNRVNLKYFNEILKRDRITLVCFCKPKSFCHRILLADELVKRGAIYMGEI